MRGAGALLNVAFIVVIALLSYVGRGISVQLDRQTATIQSIDKRVTTIEANRFTSNDGFRTQEEITRLWKELAGYPKREEVPPPLFRAQVERLEARLGNMERAFHHMSPAQPYPTPDDH